MADPEAAPAEEAGDSSTHPADDLATESGKALLPVVALGGSAGAVAALQQFFRGLPPKPGVAFVVAIHLSPDHESQFTQVLAGCTSMPVRQVHGRVRLAADTVHVVPPGKLIRVESGSLLPEPLPAGRGRHVTVDLLFRSLADSHGPHAAAVVLSGLDGDGAIGIKRIKERGGLAVAQDPEECEHDGMPRTAIATGMVDWTLPVADMPGRLLNYFRLEDHLKLPADRPQDDAGEPQEEVALRDVLAFLRTRTGRDFSSYKRATVVRRIGRRMQVNGVDGVAGYLNFLRTRPGEAPALLQDLLISVTNFFRDADSFQALQPHLRQLMRDRPSTEPVRLWVAGCATGEEAYSLAILLCEEAREMEAPPVIQVFATDLDDEAVRVAREGLYPRAIEADVSPERLRRYFTLERRGYRVRREVREMVLFARHDLLKDSPFSRVDLVSCRNLLIYLTRQAQHRVFQTFHFALKPRGMLFLGSSETCEDSGTLFSVLDKKHRVYAQTPLPRPVMPVPDGPSTLAQGLQAALRTDPEPAIGGRAFAAPAVPGRHTRAGEERNLSWGALHLKLLEALAPPSILVDREHDIVHMSGSAGRFLQHTGGEPTRNLLRLLHPGLRVEVRAALSQAAQSAEVAQVRAARVQLADGEAAVTVRARRVQELGTDLCLVVFDPGSVTPAQDAPAAQSSDLVASHLDRELERLKAQLRETVEQYEASTQELKASNEELQAMNEELRSATEELETSREELQSINEELAAVNHELKGKVEELAHAESDLQNLMGATQIASVFLDRRLEIMRYTPSAVALFNLIPTDVGRPLSDLANRLDYPGLAVDGARVLQTLVPFEREVGLAGGNWYLMRLLPYRTQDDRIVGVVLTFIDITQRRQAEEVRTWLSAVVHASTDGIVSFGLDLAVLSWNAACEQIFGYTAAEMIGHSLTRLAPPGQEQEMHDNVAQLRRGEPLRFETVRRRKDGRDIHVSLSVAPIRDADGKVMGGTTVLRDITEAKRSGQALRESEERLRLMVENARDFAIFTLDLDRRVTSWNVGAERLLGYRGEEMLGHSGDIVFTEDDRAAGAPQAEARTAFEEGRASDDRLHVRKDGTRFWASGVSMLMRDATGQAVGLVKILRDQTAERDSRDALERSQADLLQALGEAGKARQALEAADAAKDRFLAVLSHELRNPLASIASASELLMMQKLPEAAREKAAEVVQRQARAMKVLLDELLDVSRLSLGRLTLSRRPVSVLSVLQSGLETARPLVQAAGHELIVRPPPPEAEVDGDPVRLAQVVSNLVGNAAKYTPEGGRIVLGAEVHADEVVITVEDNGIGMDPASIDRMFDLFSQGSGAIQRSNSGLGIGLALSRNIVEMHGGWIMASSAGPGQGSQFRVGLPLLAGRPDAGEPAQAPEAQAPTPAPRAEGELILVADDNGDAAWGLAKLLELSGYRAVLARSGEEALQVAEEQRPGIALLDIGMPDLSGHDVARRLRETDWGRDMILIAATGWGQEADVRHSMEAGFDAHLTKPLNVGRIRSLIEELSGRRDAKD